MHIVLIFLLCVLVFCILPPAGKIIALAVPAVLAAFVWFSQADAVPADVEAFQQPAPVDYRPCRVVTDKEKWDAYFNGQPSPEAKPLAPSCVLPLPTQRATVSTPAPVKKTHYLQGNGTMFKGNGDANPFAQFDEGY